MGINDTELGKCWEGMEHMFTLVYLSLIALIKHLVCTPCYLPDSQVSWEHPSEGYLTGGHFLLYTKSATWICDDKVLQVCEQPAVYVGIKWDTTYTADIVICIIYNASMRGCWKILSQTKKGMT